MLGLGLVISRIEDWGLGDGLYFTFVTGLTIGYGDLTPKHGLARILALLIGFSGIVLTGIVTAVSVQALSHADKDPEEKGQRSVIPPRDLASTCCRHAAAAKGRH